MRHGKKGRKLGRYTSHRKAMLSNMAASLLIHKQIRTTEAKAKDIEMKAMKKRLLQVEAILTNLTLDTSELKKEKVSVSLK